MWGQGSHDADWEHVVVKVILQKSTQLQTIYIFFLDLFIQLCIIFFYKIQAFHMMLNASIKFWKIRQV